MSKNRIIFLSATLFSASAFAQEPTQTGNQPDYGDNPNLIKVLSVKTKETVTNTANQVGAATERGIAKIKPSVDSAWQNTKELTTGTAVQLRDGARQGIDTAVKKTQSLKQNLTGAGGVPIERGSLSNPGQNTQPAAVVNAPAAATPQPIESSAPISVAPAANVVNKTAPVEPAEPAIQRQSIALPATSAATSQATQQPAEVNEDSGIPR